MPRSGREVEKARTRREGAERRAGRSEKGEGRERREEGDGRSASRGRRGVVNDGRTNARASAGNGRRGMLLSLRGAVPKRAKSESVVSVLGWKAELRRKEAHRREVGRTEEQSEKAKLGLTLADQSGSKEENGRRKAAVRSGRSDGCLGSGVGCGG